MGQETGRIVATDFEEPLEATLRRWGDPLLKVLLADRTLSRPIRWVTDGVSALGEGFGRWDAMTPARVRKAVAAGLLRPRAAKSLEERQARVRAHGEVFTPAWICRRMTDLADTPWFREGAADAPETASPLREGLDWQAYVSLRRLEITCGEAPYLTARYDVDTGEPIPWAQRHGFLDRKLRVLPHTLDRAAWTQWAGRAFAATYGYEYQGDNLFLARCNLLLTFEEAHRRRWGDDPTPETLAAVAETLSWNLWQMDGFTNRPPFTTELEAQDDLFAAPDPNASDPCRIRIGTNPISVNNLQGDKTMKFDFIIGNPPYDSEVDGNDRSKPIYNYFMDAAYKISPRVLLITPARFLFNAGQTPKAWNRRMLTDSHLKVEWVALNSKRAFPSADIEGGVVVTYRDEEREFGAITLFIPWLEMKTVYAKVMPTMTASVATIITGAVPYRFSDIVKLEHPECVECIGKSFDLRTNVFDKLHGSLFFDTPHDSDEWVLVLGLENGRTRVQQWIKRKYLVTPKVFDYWKVLVPKSNGAGALDEGDATVLIGDPVLAAPKTAATQTFINIGSFETRQEAEACLKYVKTKFARAMLGILKVTPDNPRDKWSLVPLQDFTEQSDIDWSKSVVEIDRQLYAKYGLAAEEVKFIESKVKEMA